MHVPNYNFLERCKFFGGANPYAAHYKIIKDDMAQHCVDDLWRGMGAVCYEPKPITQEMIIEEFQSLFASISSRNPQSVMRELRELVNALKEILIYRNKKEAISVNKVLQDAFSSFENAPSNRREKFWNNFVNTTLDITQNLGPVTK